MYFVCSCRNTKQALGRFEQLVGLLGPSGQVLVPGMVFCPVAVYGEVKRAGKIFAMVHAGQFIRCREEELMVCLETIEMLFAPKQDEHQFKVGDFGKIWAGHPLLAGAVVEVVRLKPEGYLRVLCMGKYLEIHHQCILNLSLTDR